MRHSLVKVFGSLARHADRSKSVISNSATISQLFQVNVLAKCVVTCPGIK